MEIRIKTAEEFRDEHVTVTVKAADNDEAMRVVAALVGGTPAEGYDPAAAARLTQTEDALIAANAKLIQAESEATRLSRQIEELRDRASQRHFLADTTSQAEGRFQQSVRGDLIEARRVIRQIASLIARPGTQAAIAESPEGAVLAGALINIDAVATGYLQEVADQA